MNRFSIEGSGAQLNEEVTLNYAHRSRFAHPTATFDPSIHTNIERPTRWFQSEKNRPALRAVVGLVIVLSITQKTRTQCPSLRGPCPHLTSKSH